MKVYNLFSEHCTHQGEGGCKVHLSIDYAQAPWNVFTIPSFRGGIP